MEHTEIMKMTESIRTRTAAEAVGEVEALQRSGRYEAADELLHAVQTSLAALKDIEVQAAHRPADETIAAIKSWEQAYDTAVRRICGAPHREDDDAAAIDRLCRSGESLLEAGIMPSAAQLRAMSLTEDEAQVRITAKRLKNAARAACAK